MSNREKEREVLGKSKSAARSKLRKKIILNYCEKIGFDKCYRCGEKIDNDNYHFDHKSSWRIQENPKKYVINIENVAISHASCNVKYREIEYGKAPKISDILDCSYSTVLRDIKNKYIYHLADFNNDLDCYRCGNKISTIKKLTIDHKDPWLQTNKPKKMFYDISNIAFSHHVCNSRHGSNTSEKQKKLQEYKKKERKFSREEIIEIRKRYEEESGSKLANEFSTSASVICSIYKRRIYSDIKEPSQNYKSNLKKDNRSLNKEQVIEIRKRFSNGEKASSIAKDYPISFATVHDVSKRKTYKEI